MEKEVREFKKEIKIKLQQILEEGPCMLIPLPKVKERVVKDYDVERKQKLDGYAKDSYK